MCRPQTLQDQNQALKRSNMLLAEQLHQALKENESLLKPITKGTGKANQEASLDTQRKRQTCFPSRSPPPPPSRSPPPPPPRREMRTIIQRPPPPPPQRPSASTAESRSHDFWNDFSDLLPTAATFSPQARDSQSDLAGLKGHPHPLYSTGKNPWQAGSLPVTADEWPSESRISSGATNFLRQDSAETNQMSSFDSFDGLGLLDDILLLPETICD